MSTRRAAAYRDGAVTVNQCCASHWDPRGIPPNPLWVGGISLIGRYLLTLLEIYDLSNKFNVYACHLHFKHKGAPAVPLG